MNKGKKLISILSIACRAGKVISGEFVIEKTLSGKHNVKLILLAYDTTETTQARYEKLAEKNKILLRKTPLTKEELANCIGKENRAAAAVCDEGFCNAILKILDN